jgi:hypothetical protein
VVTIEILVKNDIVMVLLKSYLGKNIATILTTRLKNTPHNLLENFGYLGSSLLIYFHGEEHHISQGHMTHTFMHLLKVVTLDNFYSLLVGTFRLGELHIHLRRDLGGFHYII